MSTNRWCIYLLVSSTGRTYIGSTTDVHRRLRQHNGEIRGGARSTRGKKWRIHCWVSGFDGRSSACRWERLAKFFGKGITNRSWFLNQLAAVNLERTYIKGGKSYPVPHGLEIHHGRQ